MVRTNLLNKANIPWSKVIKLILSGTRFWITTLYRQSIPKHKLSRLLDYRKLGFSCNRKGRLLVVVVERAGSWHASKCWRIFCTTISTKSWATKPNDSRWPPQRTATLWTFRAPEPSCPPSHHYRLLAWPCPRRRCCLGAVIARSRKDKLDSQAQVKVISRAQYSWE